MKILDQGQVAEHKKPKKGWKWWVTTPLFVYVYAYIYVEREKRECTQQNEMMVSNDDGEQRESINIFAGIPLSSTLTAAKDHIFFFFFSLH